VIGWVSFALIGISVGISTGLSRLGRGLVSVPALSYILNFYGMPETHLIHIAVSTSLMAIIVTSFSSLLAHHRVENVD